MVEFDNPLPGIPSVESPFFERLFDAGDWRFPVAKSLNEQGFAVIDFPDEALSERAERIKSTLHGHYAWQDWAAGHGDLRYMDAWRDNEDVRSIASNAQIIDLLNYLYGRPAFPFQTLNFPVGTQQHYHADTVHFSSMPERFMCGVWVALEDVDADQGPLLYYPGSHKWPVYKRLDVGKPFTMDGGRHQGAFDPAWEALVELNGIEPVRFFPRKGQALIWAANLLHGGDRHHDRSKTRWSQVTHYYFDDCIYYSPIGSNEALGELHYRKPVDILTGLPRASSYMGEPCEGMGGGFGRSAISFDANRYLRSNPDVQASGMDAWEHYKRHGYSENRTW